MEIKKTHIIKTIFIGNSYVGKTSIINKMLNKPVLIEEQSTQGVDFFVDKKIISGINIKNQIWDLAGDSRFSSIIKSYYRGISLCVLVFDITNLESFEKIPIWLHHLFENTDNPNCSKILIGNKLDKILKRQVSKSIAVDFANKNNMTYIETSTRTYDNLTNLLSNSISSIIKLSQEKDIMYANTSDPKEKLIETYYEDEDDINKTDCNCRCICF
jgi:small GTP-binding protein